MTNKISLATNNKPRGTMAILLAAIFMTLLDVSIVNVALPSMQQALSASGSTLQWIISGYTLAMGLLLIPAGRLGDNIGHKKTFLAGLTLFSLASLASALAQDPAMIIISRFFQGLGAGIYTPSVIAYIQLLYQGRARSRAFSIFGAVIGIATAIGPLLGGILVHIGGGDWGWRLIFLVNIPIALIVLPLAIRKLPIGKSSHEHHHKLDPIGIVAVAVALMLVLFPIVEGRSYNWPWWVWLCLALSVVLFLALWQWEKKLEKRGREPLLAIHVLKTPSFSLGAFTSLVYFSAFTSIFFVMSLLWQEGFARGALATGIMLSPFAIGNLISSSQSHRMSHWLGYKVQVIGTSLMAVSLILMLVIINQHNGAFSAWLLVAPLFLGGLANGFFIAPNQDFALKSVPGRDAGSASGMFQTSQRVGAAIGIAAVGTMLFSNLHFGPTTGAAQAFAHATDLALRLNVILVLATLVLTVMLWFYAKARQLDPKTS